MSGPLWQSMPSGWRAGKIRHLGEVALGKMLQPKPTDGSVKLPYLRAANVQPDGELVLDDLRSMFFRPSEVEELTLRTDDVVVVEGGQGGFGRAAHVAEDLSDLGFQNSINRVRPYSNADGRFITYYLLALRAADYIRAFSNVVSMPHLTAEKLAALPAPVPPLPEQRAIADYLDRETAQIDTLIEEQQALSALQSERRTAVLARAFSDPPTHSLRRTIELAQTGPFGTQLSSEEYVVNGVPVVNPSHIVANRISPDPAVSVSLEKAGHLSRHQMSVGDIVLARKGGVDKAALVDAESDGFVCGSDSMLLRASPGTDPTYLWWFLQSPTAHHQLDYWSVGATVAGLNQNTISKIMLPLPDLDLQRQTAAELEAAVRTIDQLDAETLRMQTLARERRSALITAAVTGQIDVKVPA